jgi:hypothetical protein
VDVLIEVFLTSALVEDEWSASRFGRFTPTESVPGTLRIGVGLDDVEKKEFLTFLDLEF